MRFIVLLGCVLLAQSASAQSPMANASGQTIDGISCDAQEGQRIHIHQHLLIVDHGTLAQDDRCGLRSIAPFATLHDYILNTPKRLL